MLIVDLLLLMRRVEKRIYDSHRLRDELFSLRLILRIGKFRAIEKRCRAGFWAKGASNGQNTRSSDFEPNTQVTRPVSP
jgi:hypothetical protein